MGAPVLITDDSTSLLSNGSVVHSTVSGQVQSNGVHADRKQPVVTLTNGCKLAIPPTASQHDSPLSYHSSPSNGGPVEGVDATPTTNGGMQGLWHFEDMPNSFSFIPLSQISMMLPQGDADSQQPAAAPVLSADAGLTSTAPRRQGMESSEDTTTSLDKDGNSYSSVTSGGEALKVVGEPADEPEEAAEVNRMAMVVGYGRPSQRNKGTRSSRTSPRLALATHSEEVSTATEAAAHPTVSSSGDTPAQQLANLQIPDAPASSLRPRSLPSPKTPGKCMLWNFPANPAPTPPAAAAKKAGKKRGADEAKDGTRRRKLPELPQRSSVYRGVTRHRWTGRYEAHLWDSSCLRNNTTGKGRTKGRQVYLGGYESEITAARAYDRAAIKYWGEGATLNHPYDDYLAELEVMKGMTNEEYVAHLRRLSSGFSRGASNYRGVTKHHQHGRWEARIGRVMGNKYLYLGTFNSEEEAAKAYDVAAIKHRGPKAVTNFSLSNYDVAAIQAAPSNVSVATETKKRVVRAEGGAGKRGAKAKTAAAAAAAEKVAYVDVKSQLEPLDVSEADAQEAASDILSPAVSASTEKPTAPALAGPSGAASESAVPANIADFLKFSSDEYNSDEAAEMALKYLSVPESAGVAALGATQWGSFRNKLASALGSGSSDDEIVSMIARRKKSLRLDVSAQAFPTEEAMWPFSDMLGSGNEEVPTLAEAWSQMQACLPGTATLQACMPAMPASPMNFSPSTMVTGLWPTEPTAADETPATEPAAVLPAIGESPLGAEAVREPSSEVPAIDESTGESPMAISPTRRAAVPVGGAPFPP